MELAKPQEPLKFAYKDVTFLVRPKSIEADRLEVWGSGQVEDGKIISKQAEFVKALIRCMVVGWEGVTEDGKPVPYSFETFLARFPNQGRGEANVFLQLGDFIFEKTDIWKQDEAEKNASRAQSAGSSTLEPSTAPGKTAERRVAVPA